MKAVVKSKADQFKSNGLDGCVYNNLQGGPKVGLHLVGMHFIFVLNILLHLYVFATIIFVQCCLCTFI